MPVVFTPQDLAQLPTDQPVYGVIGWPVAHSLSPAMQQAAFDACGLPARYLKIAITPDELPAAVETMRNLPFAGWNCTIPHKNQLFCLMDGCDESSRTISGVNTVLNTNGKLTGHSTDGRGWSRAIREDFEVDIRGLRILLLGAGGAGQAIAHQAVIEECRKLVITNRTAQTAAELAQQLNRPDIVQVLPWDKAAFASILADIDLIVNASSVGLKTGDAPVLSAELLTPAHKVYDTIYNPSPTGLITEARLAGAQSANGLSMLLHQGALAFEIWTGGKAPLDIMKNALLVAAGAQIP
jgi:shikimate dehydrogenase